MTHLKTRWLQVVIHIAAIFPVGLLIWDYSQDQLTANPIQAITFRTGKTALVLLMLSLACSPITTVFGLSQLIVLRKTLGLYAFAYVVLHFLTFVGLDYQFDPGLLQEAIFQKRYALVGFGAFLILLPLAITSTKDWMRRLGRNWKRLHRLVYLAGVLAVVHFVWLVKSDLREPLTYGAVLLLLLLLRLTKVKKAAKSLLSNFPAMRRGCRSITASGDPA